MSVITEIHLKNLTLHVPPFKATQGHRNQCGSTSCLWLLTNALSGTVSEINGEFSRKSHIFPTPSIYLPS